jgi:pimeloyl-ACP methyl ester carboxylesterase
MLHGWLDMSITFQFIVDSLRQPWSIVAPDWSGYGRSYWQRGLYSVFHDLADLDALIDHYSPETPVFLVGHSYGGNMAGLYAGTRADRVKRLISLEGFGQRQRTPQKAPKIITSWLDAIKRTQNKKTRTYDGVDQLAKRFMKSNPRLSQSRARFLAQHMTTPASEYRAALAIDPWRRIRALPASFPAGDFFEAFFARIAAPTLWARGSDSGYSEYIFTSEANYRKRFSILEQGTDIKVEDAGHNLHHDQPERIASIMEDFFLAEN